MPVMTTTRNRPRSFYEGSGYTPHQIGDWVAVDERDLPWNTIGHALAGSSGNGQTVAAKMTAREVLDAAGLNITVEKYPLQVVDGDRLDRLFVTGYEDADGRHYFGAVMDKYQVVQPVEALSFFDHVIASVDGAHYTAAWNMREKSMMGVTIDLPEEIVVDPDGANDRTGLHLLGINSFDGSTGLSGALTTTRWFCMNQLVPSLKRAQRRFSMRHTKNVMGSASVAADMIGMARHYASELDAVANGLHAASMSDAQFQKFLARVPVFALKGDESDTVKNRVLERRTEAIQHWEAPHNENIRGTRWGALNVVAEYIEWGRTVRGSNRTGTDPVRQRAIGTMVHPTVTSTVDTAMDILTAMR